MDQCNKKALWAGKLPYPFGHNFCKNSYCSVRGSLSSRRILLVGVINIHTCDKYHARYVQKVAPCSLFSSYEMFLKTILFHIFLQKKSHSEGSLVIMRLQQFHSYKRETLYFFTTFISKWDTLQKEDYVLDSKSFWLLEVNQ